MSVAPRVGAWIETKMLIYPRNKKTMSHPVWVRGLKLNEHNIGFIPVCRTPCGCVD